MIMNIQINKILLQTYSYKQKIYKKPESEYHHTVFGDHLYHRQTQNTLQLNTTVSSKLSDPAYSQNKIFKHPKIQNYQEKKKEQPKIQTYQINHSQ